MSTPISLGGVFCRLQRAERLLRCCGVLAGTCTSIAAAREPPALASSATSPAPPTLAKGATKTASGLAMKVLIRGTGKARPTLNDCVKLSFIAWSSDGSVFARSPADGSPNTECVRRLTVGVAEAVRAMVVGERRRVWVPARLNTFADGDGHAQQPASALTYELTLVEIITAPPTPTPLKVPDPQARRMPSGLSFKWLNRGSGSVHPSALSRVSLQVSGWTTDGALFESTRMAGQPASYAVSDLLPGLREGVALMVVGDRARLWLPAALAYGTGRLRRGQPAGPLVYDLELCSIEGPR